MKKILEHGDKHFKGRCPRCGCRFDYDLSDIYQDTENYKQELLHNEWCLVCPECENLYAGIAQSVAQRTCNA